VLKRRDSQNQRSLKELQTTHHLVRNPFAHNITNYISSTSFQYREPRDTFSHIQTEMCWAGRWTPSPAVDNLVIKGGMTFPTQVVLSLARSTANGYTAVKQWHTIKKLQNMLMRKNKQEYVLVQWLPLVICFNLSFAAWIRKCSRDASEYRL